MFVDLFSMSEAKTMHLNKQVSLNLHSRYIQLLLSLNDKNQAVHQEIRYWLVFIKSASFVRFDVFLGFNLARNKKFSKTKMKKCYEKFVLRSELLFT